MKPELFAGTYHRIYSPPRIRKKTAANKSPLYFLTAHCSLARIGEDWREIKKAVQVPTKYPHHPQGFPIHGSSPGYSRAGNSHRIIFLGCAL